MCVVQWAPRAPSWLSCYFVMREPHTRVWQIDLHQRSVPRLARHCVHQERDTCSGEKSLFISVLLEQERSVMWWEVHLTTAECCALSGRKELQSYKVLLLLKENFLWKISHQSWEKCYRWDDSLGENDWLKLNTNQASSEAACYNL